MINQPSKLMTCKPFLQSHRQNLQICAGCLEIPECCDIWWKIEKAWAINIEGFGILRFIGLKRM
jgi:hypothetical protein